MAFKVVGTMSIKNGKFIIPVLPLEYRKLQRKYVELAGFCVQSEASGELRGLHCIHIPVGMRGLAEMVWISCGDTRYYDIKSRKVAL